MRGFLPLLVIVTSASAIWPIPAKYEHGETVLWIARDVKINYCKSNSTSLSGWNKTLASSGPLVQDAIQRAHHTIFSERFVPWKFHPRNSDFEPPANGSKNYVGSIDVIQRSADSGSVVRPRIGEVSEAYSLTVAEDGKATIAADTSVGVLRALETFTQLWYQHSESSSGVYTNLVPVNIEDAPKFPYRGLNLDVARNYYEPEDVMRTIDALAYNKFNHLHIHATDSQSWPLDIPALPELSAKGAYHKGLSWTPDVYRDIQAYGAARAVEVVTEIDLPGHTASIGNAFPDLLTPIDDLPTWDDFSKQALKLNSSAVYDFLETLFDDLLPRLSPYSAYFHTGGDELFPEVYLKEEGVNSNDSAVIQGLLQKFVDRNHDQVRALGLTPIVWEETLVQFNLTLGEDVIVQVWKSSETVLETINRGHKALVGSTDFWYLDCGKGQWLNSDNGAAFEKSYPFNDYCTPIKSWRLVYAYDPVANIPPEKQSLVLGGEVHSWSEQTDPVNVDSTIWPRASAAGEVLWSGRQDASGRNRSQIEAYPRLTEWRERMVLRGISAASISHPYCTQSDSSACELL
ncbi:MAG: N-acetyl-glucosamine-6-phosphate deacetylase [Sclerophora amabilis]|nr:MAG: N-acetyl-glucosamine-6-phosphate deacetylase [Sclerophora amabilis]